MARSRCMNKYRRLNVDWKRSRVPPRWNELLKTIRLHVGLWTHDWGTEHHDVAWETNKWVKWCDIFKQDDGFNPQVENWQHDRLGLQLKTPYPVHAVRYSFYWPATDLFYFLHSIAYVVKLLKKILIESNSKVQSMEVKWAAFVNSQEGQTIFGRRTFLYKIHYLTCFIKN